MKKAVVRWKEFAGLCLAMGLAGCLGAPTPSPVSYVFTPAAGWESVATRDLAPGGETVHFAPVTLPAYLDRPQLVTSTPDGILKVDEFNRWGVPLATGVAEVVGSLIAREFPEVFVDPEPCRGKHDHGWCIRLNLLRLDGSASGPVDAVVQWEVLRNGTTAFRRLGHYSAPVEGEGPAAYVAGTRAVLALLGKDIAKAMDLSASAEKVVTDAEEGAAPTEKKAAASKPRKSRKP